MIISSALSAVKRVVSTEKMPENQTKREICLFSRRTKDGIVNAGKSPTDFAKTEEAAMANLQKTKRRMKLDKAWRKTLVRSAKNEILIDLDGDREADVMLMDTAGDGDIDTIAVDLTGDGEFNLFFTDTDHNGVPDAVFLDSEGNGKLEVLGVGSEVEAALTSAAARLDALLLASDYAAAELDRALEELDKDVRAARRQLKKRR